MVHFVTFMPTQLSVAFIERLALCDGLAPLMLIAASTAMVVMVIKLACLVVEDLGTNRYWKALKQLLPLSAFPKLFFIFEMPECSYMYFILIQRHALSTPNEAC